MKNVVFIIFYLVCVNSYSQEITQNVRGVIRDRINNIALSGATVSVDGSDFNAVSDQNGFFEISNIPVGRYLVEFRFTGYQSVKLPVVVSASKPEFLEVFLDESVITLNEVMVNQPLYMSNLSRGFGKQISIEQTNRIPANFFDPVRMITSFPGVMASNDQANNLIIRGQSPLTIQWKLEGMDVLNPNHQANAGTLSDMPVSSGGGVNMLSAQMLGNTQLIQGPAPAEMGNGVSQINMNLRSGNEDPSTTLQASLIGLDAAREGKLGKGTYLANYRYSTVGILTGVMGLDFGGETITFQDFSYSVDQPLGTGDLKLFGVLGSGQNHFQNAEPVDEEKDWFDIDYTGRTSILGGIYKGDNGLKIGATYSSTVQKRTSNGVENEPAFGENSRFYLQDQLFSFLIRKSTRLNASNILEYGVHSSIRSATFKTESTVGNSNWMIHQPYVKLNSILNEKWMLESGIRYFGSFEQNSGRIEPRLRVDYLLSDKSIWSVGYGTQTWQMPTTFLLSQQDHLKLKNPYFQLINSNWSREWKNELRSNVSVYGQKGDLLPANSAVNGMKTLYNFLDEIPNQLFIENSESRNYGVEITIEKPLIDHFYGLAGASVYRSEVKPEWENNWESSRFDGNYTFNFTAGYENYKQKESVNRKINANIRLLMIGGMNEYEVDLNQSRLLGSTQFSNQLLSSGNYFRLDFSISHAKQRDGFNRVLSLDLQNVTGYQNPGMAFYDRFTDSIEEKQQLGLIPVLSYRVEF